MKPALYSLICAVLLAGACAPAAAQQGNPVAMVEPGASAWKSPDKLQQKLAAEIQRRLPELDSKAVKSFLKKDENRRLLYMYMLASNETGAQEGYSRHNNNLQDSLRKKQAEVENLEKEVKNKKGAEKVRSQYLLDCARDNLRDLKRESKYPADITKCGKVLKAVLADDGWMEQILFSGEMANFTRVVQIIDAVADADPDALKKGVERDTTTAIALEYARYGGHVTAAVERARYFLKNWRLGRLNVSFDKLPMHQRRVVCGWKLFHSSGTIKAFEWALDNVHLPDWQYPASCWRCGYILDNVYGDSVHGPYYYAAWAGVLTDNHMAITKQVGGVCGSLSHFGAASACANGVPALTAGEPGHCAYIVLVNGKWTPAYSLSWERGLHWIPWNDNHTFSSLHLTDALYDASKARDTRTAQAYRVLAHVYQNAGEKEKAIACYEKSAEAAPLNYPMWREYAAFLAKDTLENKKAWKKLHSVLCEGVAGSFPEQAAELLKRYVYNRIVATGFSAKEMASLCADFWKYAENMGPDRWYVESFADRQLQICKQVGGNAEEASIELFTKVLANAAAHDAYAGMMMTWGNKISDSLSEAGRKQLMDSTLRVLSKGTELDSAKKARLLGGLILAAEKSRDTTTFHALSQMVDPKEIHGTAAIPEIRPYPGRIVSEGGLPFASSTSQWDVPHTHSGLLTKQGGRIHTARENDPWIAVKLPKHAYVTGVVFAGTNDWTLISRFRPVKVQVSDTGRADDWHDVGAPIPDTGNYIISFDLQKERPKALYVRVLRPGGPEVFHANGIYVFGEPAA